MFVIAMLCLVFKFKEETMRLAIVAVTAMCVAAAGGQRLPQLLKGSSFKHSQLFVQLAGSPAIPRVV